MVESFPAVKTDVWLVWKVKLIGGVYEIVLPFFFNMGLEDAFRKEIVFYEHEVDRLSTHTTS